MIDEVFERILATHARNEELRPKLLEGDRFNTRRRGKPAAANKGVIQFALPKDAGEGSYSVPQDGIETVSFECWDLTTIMGKNSHSYIDLLKIDIEGFEYDVIDKFLEDRVPIHQLCVEFHPWL